MIESEFKSMLEYISNNKKAFKQLYKRGFFSYSRDGAFIGEVAIVNEKAVVAFLQKANDEKHIIASANFEAGANLIYTLSGNNYSIQQFGKSIIDMNDSGFYTSRGYSLDKNGISRDISCIRTHCSEAKEKAKTQKSISFLSRLSKKSSSSKRLSKQEILSLLEKTIDKLADKSQVTDKQNSRAEISPKTEISHPTSQNISQARSTSNNITR